MAKEVNQDNTNPQGTTPANVSNVRSRDAQPQTQTASGRWVATHRARLPHKAGLPLSSGGGGDGIER